MLLSPFTPDQAEETRRMVETNLLGAMTTLEVFLEQLRNGGGDLVNISSVAGRTAKPGSSVYNATKWGLNGWSEALRQELQGDDIRVIVIEPGAIAPGCRTTSPTSSPSTAPRRCTPISRSRWRTSRT